jgi:hypothetical protein
MRCKVRKIRLRIGGGLKEQGEPQLAFKPPSTAQHGALSSLACARSGSILSHQVWQVSAWVQQSVAGKMSAEEPELSGSGSELAPDEDFVEADAEASTELGGEEAEPTEEFDTEDEAPEEVRPGSCGTQRPALACWTGGQCARLRPDRAMWGGRRSGR